MKKLSALEALGKRYDGTRELPPGLGADDKRMLSLYMSAYPALAPAVLAAPEAMLPMLRDLGTARDRHDFERGFSPRDDEPFAEALARRCRTELLRIAARELFVPGNPVSDTARELSELAEFAIEAALREARQWAKERYALPLHAEGGPPFVVMGMGKLGGHELNAQSDIDLVFFHGAENDDGADADETVAVLTRVAQRLVNHLESPTAAGAAYRVDLRLRPEGRAGPLVMSLAAAERYYESWGRTWERAALLRARPVAGEIGFGREVLAALSPFVWRRRVDPEIPRELARLLLQARATSADPERDLKVGWGGIREVEFFVQALCLVWGGREPLLRSTHTLDAIRKLRVKGYVTDREARDLLDAYVILRAIEHRVQFATMEQTHRLPQGELLERVATSFGYVTAAELEARLERVRRRVHDHYRRLTGELGEDPWLSEVWSALEDGDRELLERALGTRGVGFEDLPSKLLALARRPDLPLGSLTRERYPQFARSLVEALLDVADPEMAAERVGQFFARLRTPSVYVSMLENDVHVLRRFVSLAGGSAELGQSLVGHPELFDSVLFAKSSLREPLLDGADSAGDPASLRPSFEVELARAEEEFGAGAEALVAASRRLKAEVTLRMGVRDLGGELGPEAVSDTLSATADFLLERTVEHALREVSVDRGLSAVAMGKLGGRELSYGSDLDLFFVYDPSAFDDEELAFRAAARVLRLLGVPHGAGTGYELDTRLRPSGNQGLLVTSEASFARYHGLGWRDGELEPLAEGAKSHGARAHAWERQALLRARAVAGDRALGARVERVAERVAYTGGAPELERLIELRLRMQHEAARPGHIDVKLGPGGLVDVEFLVQMLQMRHGTDPRVRHRSTDAALRALVEVGALAEEPGLGLLRHYWFLRRLEQRLRIVYGRSETLVVREGPALLTLARRMGFFGDGGRRSEDAFVEALARTMAEIRAVFLTEMSPD